MSPWSLLLTGWAFSRPPTRLPSWKAEALIAFGGSEEIFERHLSRPQVAPQFTLPESAPDNREHVSGASCAVIWRRRDTQPQSPVLLLERAVAIAFEIFAVPPASRLCPAGPVETLRPLD